jgi:hypothetical protein
VRFQKENYGLAGWSEAWLPKPAPPAGYTGNTVITEWLTVNCQGDWASPAGARALHVRFADADDRARAVARFGELSGSGKGRGVPTRGD